MSATSMSGAATEGDPVLLDVVLREAESRLADAGVASARHDAESLAAFALDVERSALSTWSVLGVRLDAQQALDVQVLVDRRARREPLQHIVGRTTFRRIELAVGPGVFVPRPETELVAQTAIDELALLLTERGIGQPLVVDLCSGSGALALSIASETPSARVHAVELSDDAVLWLRRNVDELSLKDRVSVHHDDAAVAPRDLFAEVDVLVCNPPYIPAGATIRDPEVARFDPAFALWGGDDGLDVVRGVITNAERLVRPDGLLLIEHADVQGQTLPSLLRDRRGVSGVLWEDVVDHDDLNGLPRFTSARRTQAAPRETVGGSS